MIDIRSSWTVDEHGARPLGTASRKRMGPAPLSDEVIRGRLLTALGSEWITRSQLLAALGSGSVRARSVVILDALVESGVVEQQPIGRGPTWRKVRRAA